MKTIGSPEGTSTAARLASRLGPFRHRPFSVYWSGGLMSNLGTWLQAVAGSVLVYQLTGSAFAVGVLNFLGFLPILIFSVTGGEISDRFDRRTVVVVSSVISAGMALALSIVTFTNHVTDWEVVAVAFALNTAWALAKPSMISILPSLVERDEISDAVGLNTLQFILGQIAGPILATLILATGGPGWAFAFNAITFLGPVASMVYLRRRGLGGPSLTAHGRRAASSVRVSAVAFIRSHPWVLWLLAGVFASSAPLEVVRTLSPALAVEGLGQPDAVAGLIVAAQSVGSALGMAAFIPLRRRGWSHRLAAVGLGLQALGLTGTALAPSLPIMLVSVGLVGVGFSLCFPVLTGALQLEVPDDVRGRVMALHQMSHLGNRPFVALVAGGLAVVVGAQPAVLIGVAVAPLGLVASRRAWASLRLRGAEGGQVEDRDEPQVRRSPPGSEDVQPSVETVA